MILSRLTDLIRFEAGLSGSSTHTAYIQETILEILRDLTAIDLYQELLIIDQTGTLTLAGQSSVNLPSDYQHLRADRMRYLPAGVDDDSYFLLETEYFDSPNDGVPVRYQLSAKAVKLFPNSESASGDMLKYDYYRAVTALVDADEFPVPSLQSTVKKRTIARIIRMMGKDASAQQQDSQQSLADSKGDGTDHK